MSYNLRKLTKNSDSSEQSFEIKGRDGIGRMVARVLGVTTSSIKPSESCDYIFGVVTDFIVGEGINDVYNFSTSQTYEFSIY
jgi:hypothetical protein